MLVCEYFISKCYSLSGKMGGGLKTLPCAGGSSDTGRVHLFQQTRLRERREAELNGSGKAARIGDMLRFPDRFPVILR